MVSCGEKLKVREEGGCQSAEGKAGGGRGEAAKGRGMEERERKWWMEREGRKGRRSLAGKGKEDSQRGRRGGWSKEEKDDDRRYSLEEVVWGRESVRVEKEKWAWLVNKKGNGNCRKWRGRAEQE
ncbi:hypothetical protein Pmani_033742 [Petrolisthes manimaculis]|uniref:Uncharacterized protein n=1 Tax=Petrolisthes manimaculis TaxID=1843537 RepID=A0AAE1NQZ0_9EUCA|nr:hypothetical protein Pmani_033742 [Petrolisthes manimaculis]